MLTEDISTDITELELEIERLREDFQEKVRVIESRITTIKKQLPKSTSSETSRVKGCKVRVVNGKYKGLEGKVTRVSSQSAWVQRGDKQPFLKRKHDLRVL